MNLPTPIPPTHTQLLDTIELRVGRGFGQLIAWVIVNGEPVAGYSHSRSWAKARRLAQADAGNRFYMARHLGLVAHPHARPQWRPGWEAL